MAAEVGRMVNTRHKDRNWIVADNEGVVRTWPQAHAALLMDIRDELKKLNGLLHCQNFQDIPRILRAIRRQLPAPKVRHRIK